MDRAIEILSLFPSSSLACACLITRLRLFSPFSSVFPFCNIVCQERLAWNIKRSFLREIRLFSSPILACWLRNLKNVLCKPYLCFPSSWAWIRRFVWTNVYPGVSRAGSALDASTTQFRTHFTGRVDGKSFSSIFLNFSRTCKVLISSLGNQITQIKLENFSPEFYFLYSPPTTNCLECVIPKVSLTC